MLDILTDCLYRPTFPQEHIETAARPDPDRHWSSASTTRSAMASLRYYELMYPDHPYGRSRLGYQRPSQA